MQLELELKIKIPLGQQISNTCEIVEVFNEHFVKVGKRLGDEIPQSVCSPTAILIKLALDLSLWRYLPQILSA